MIVIVIEERVEMLYKPSKSQKPKKLSNKIKIGIGAGIAGSILVGSMFLNQIMNQTNDSKRGKLNDRIQPKT